MNAFVEHHRESIRFQYSCFDRILFNAIIQPLQRPPVIYALANGAITHNSHGSDAFRYLAMGLRSATLSPRPAVRVPPMVYSFTAPAGRG
jgi:hypothetical protein